MTPGDLPQSKPSQSAVYSISHTFVVEFHRDGVANGTLSGRLEHLPSGRAGRFGDVAELGELVRTILRSTDPEGASA